MTTRQARWGRLDRLAGNGNSEAGIDLASLFRDILNQIQDSTEAVPASALAKTAQAAVSNHARVEHWYSQFSDDPWGELLKDALGQLEARGLIIKAVDGGWKTDDEKFATGKRLVVVPKRSRKNQSVAVILYPTDERAARGEAEQQRMEIASLAASLREDGPGLRPLDAAHVAALEQSMRDYGYQPEFPVLVDKQGRILDGRHRIAAARRAGVKVPKLTLKEITSDEKAVGFAILVNIQRGWTQAERTRIDRILQAAGLTMESFGKVVLGRDAQRELIKAALLENPQLTHSAIAKRLDLNHKQVDRVCADLVANGTLSHCEHRVTEDGKAAPGTRPKSSSGKSSSGNPRQVDEETKEAIIQEMQRRLEASENTDFRHVAAEQGVGEAFVQQCIAIAKDRIRQAAQVAEAIASEPASTSAASSSQHASEPSRPERLMRRISRLLSRWEAEADDPASELEELEALRREIDERMAALRQEPDHD